MLRTNHKFKQGEKIRNSDVFYYYLLPLNNDHYPHYFCNATTIVTCELTVPVLVPCHSSDNYIEKIFRESKKSITNYCVPLVYNTYFLRHWILNTGYIRRRSYVKSKLL